MPSIKIPKTQKVALVRELGGPIEFVNDYPVKMPGQDEVLAKVLYTGVCQSGKSAQRSPRAPELTVQHKTSTPPEAQQPGQTANPSQQSNSPTSADTKV